MPNKIIVDLNSKDGVLAVDQRGNSVAIDPASSRSLALKHLNGQKPSESDIEQMPFRVSGKKDCLISPEYFQDKIAEGVESGGLEAEIKGLTSMLEHRHVEFSAQDDFIPNLCNNPGDKNRSRG